MDELIFSVMDIPREVSKLLAVVEDMTCSGMTDTEKEAYNFGVRNALNALQSLLELNDTITVHSPGLKESVEMDVKKLEDRFLNN